MRFDREPGLGARQQCRALLPPWDKRSLPCRVRSPACLDAISALIANVWVPSLTQVSPKGRKTRSNLRAQAVL